MIDSSQFLKDHAPKFPKASVKNEPFLRSEAYKFALRSLSAAGASEKRLRERMKRKGFSQEEAEKSIQSLKAMGFLNDKDLARQIVQKSAKAMEGEPLIRLRLLKAGIGEEDAMEAIGEGRGEIEEGGERFSLFLREESGSDFQKALKLCKKKGQPLKLAMKIGASYTPGSVTP